VTAISKDLVGRIGGIMPAIPTPMDARGRVDVAAAARLVEWHVARGVDGVFACGTTGEGPLLDDAERVAVVRAVVDAAAGRVITVGQVGGITTDATRTLARSMAEVGVTAVGVLAPYFYKHGPDSLITHFAEVARAVPGVPVLLYNIPQNTGNAITPEVVRGLRDVPNIVGMKDSTGDAYGVWQIARSAGPEFRILVGADLLMPSVAAMGLAGAISGPAAAAPEPYVALWRAAARGAWSDVLKEYRRVAAVCHLLKNGADIPRIKAALAARGVIEAYTRPPLLTVSAGAVEALKPELDAALTC
jgi:4-hydroxy-tetrahydrodipicolinate synthase